VLSFIFALPLVCAVAFVVLLVRGPRRGLAIGLMMCCVTMAAGYWAIVHSRGSTAGIGFLFLPGAGALSGALATVFARLRLDPRPAVRAVAWLLLLASAGVAASYGVGGAREQVKNRDRDRQAEESRRLINQNRLTIAQLVRNNEGHEDIALDAEIERHRADRTFLIPALESPFVSGDRLDALSANDDLGVVLMVARNPNTRSDTLERIYRTSSYPPYFFQALGGHKNTPVAILRHLADQPAPMSSEMIDRALAQNPSAPRDILDRLAGRGDVYTLRYLLGNPALDCGLLRKAAPRLAPGDRNEVHSSDATIAGLEARLCAP
jgi:hypothetical protein